jgi:tetratricopeptide (TPR) repeat protein
MLTVVTLLIAPASVISQGRIALPVSLDELEKRAKADSNDAAAHYNLALGYWNGRKWDQVESSLKTALELDPRMALARLALSRMPYVRWPKLEEDLFQQGGISRERMTAVQAADREWRHAFMIDPMVDLKILAAAYTSGIDRWLLQDAIGEVWGNYFQASIDCYEGRYDACEQRFARVIDDFQDAGPGARVPDGVYFLKGLAAARVKKYGAAIADFRTLIQREEARGNEMRERDLVRVPLQTNEYRYFVASFMHADGQIVGATQMYQTAVENDLGLYMAHVRLANIHEGQREYAKAIAERRMAINANPDDATLHLDLGIVLGKSGDFAAAETAIRVTTERIPRHTEAWYWLAIAREQQGNVAGARAAYQKVIELAPSRLKPRADAARQKLAALP